MTSFLTPIIIPLVQPHHSPPPVQHLLHLQTPLPTLYFVSVTCKGLYLSTRLFYDSADLDSASDPLLLDAMGQMLPMFFSAPFPNSGGLDLVEWKEPEATNISSILGSRGNGEVCSCNYQVLGWTRATTLCLIGGERASCRLGSLYDHEFTGLSSQPSVPRVIHYPQVSETTSFTYNGSTLTSFTHCAQGFSISLLSVAQLSLICRSSRDNPASPLRSLTSEGVLYLERLGLDFSISHNVDTLIGSNLYVTRHRGKTVRLYQDEVMGRVGMMGIGSVLNPVPGRAGWGTLKLCCEGSSQLLVAHG